MFLDRTSILRRVTTLLDIGVTTLIFLASPWLRTFFVHGEPIHYMSHVALFPFILALWLFALTVVDAYRTPPLASALTYVWSVTRAAMMGLGMLLVILFLLKVQYVGRAVLIIFAGLDVLALVGIRLGILCYFHWSLRRGENFRRVLIVGTGARARRVAESLLQNSDWGIRIVGHLDRDPARTGTRVLEASVLGSLGDIGSVLKEHVIDEVILAIPRQMIPDVEKIAQACEEEGVTLSMMADVFDVRVARIRLRSIGPIPLLTLEAVAQEEWKLLVKRGMDFVLVIAVLPMLIPVIGLIALAIKLDSRGPVFFTQERVGLRKRRFRMLKFRTMIVGAELLQAKLEHLNEAQGPIFKIARDPRITRVGRLLRRSSLDELPQIFHVLTGIMSLVGPRPMSVRDVDRFDQGLQRKRFSVKPGLTCLWQISGRSSLPFSRWLELDLFYISHWSLSLDVRILFKTLPAVLIGRGAV
jgi:exopolysaccharide biosynthesis polyprenyl glycosylphosphotransferase